MACDFGVKEHTHNISKEEKEAIKKSTNLAKTPPKIYTEMSRKPFESSTENMAQTG